MEILVSSRGKLSSTLVFTPIERVYIYEHRSTYSAYKCKGYFHRNNLILLKLLVQVRQAERKVQHPNSNEIVSDLINYI